MRVQNPRLAADQDDERADVLENIDSRYQRLSGLIDQMQQVVETREQPQRLLRLLDQYNDETLRLFSAEEILMLKAGYPDYVEHRELHSQSAIYSMHLNGRQLIKDPGMARQLVCSLRNWLVAHRGVDTTMHQFVEQY